MLWNIFIPISPPTSDSPSPQEINVINVSVYVYRGILSLYKQMHTNTFLFFVQVEVYILLTYPYVRGPLFPFPFSMTLDYSTMWMFI